MSTISRSRPASASLPQLTAEEIAEALGGRRTRRGYRVPCPSHHPDRHPSLDVEQRDGRVLLVCRSGCAQQDVIGALRERGLWRGTGEHQRAVPRFTFVEPKPLDRPQFEFEMLVAHLMSNITDAIAELRTKYDRAGRALDAGAVRGEIEYAIPFGAIVPTGMPEDAVAEVLDHVLGNDAPPENFIPLVLDGEVWK